MWWPSAEPRACSPPAWCSPRLGPLGIAVKVEDGAARAAGPAVAALLAGLGVETPDAVRSAPVLGGGMPRGAIEAVPRLAELVAARVA